VAEPIEPRDRPAGYFDLLRDLEGPGCVVCRGAHQSAWRFIDALLWERVTDPGTRYGLRRSRGFCREHSLLAISVAGASSEQLGLAIIAEDLVGRVGEAVASTQARTGRRPRHRPDEIDPQEPCPVCRSAGATVSLYLQLLASAGQAIEPSHEQLPVLCLPHLRIGLERVEDAAGEQKLRALFADGAAKVRADLQEFIRKRDHRFRHEVVKRDEANAWARAIHLLVGAPMRRPPDR
jgi:hypothetical protein